MNILRRLVFVAFITTSSTGLFGCFYYSKDIQPAPVAVEPLPATSASVTTSTTTTDQDGYQKKQTTTTYGTP